MPKRKGIYINALFLLLSLLVTCFIIVCFVKQHYIAKVDDFKHCYKFSSYTLFTFLPLCFCFIFWWEAGIFRYF